MGAIRINCCIRVAFLALPSLCYNLDLDSSASRQPGTNHPRANIYQHFLKVLQLRYEGTDTALDNMTKLLHDVNVQDATSPLTARTGSQSSPTDREESIQAAEPSMPTKSGKGLEIIISEPQKYIQMSYTLDFFLCRGRFPAKDDIPLPNFLVPQGLVEGSNGSDLVSGIAGRTSAKMAKTNHFVPSDVPNQATNNSLPQVASSTESNGFTVPNEVSIGTPEVSTMLTDDSLRGINPDDFYLDDFMTDGPFAGIEQLQNMLHNYPG